MFICNADDLSDGPDGAVTQSCFNKYPLDRAADDDDASPIDPAFPGRYILDPPCRASETDQSLLDGAFPGDVATARYQLPSGLTCDRCVVQFVYCEYVVQLFILFRFQVIQIFAMHGWARGFLLLASRIRVNYLTVSAAQTYK